jgi:hypothetical protein
MITLSTPGVISDGFDWHCFFASFLLMSDLFLLHWNLFSSSPISFFLVDVFRFPICLFVYCMSAEFFGGDQILFLLM